MRDLLRDKHTVFPCESSSANTSSTTTAYLSIVLAVCPRTPKEPLHI